MRRGLRRLLWGLAGTAVVAGLVVVGFLTRDTWMPLLRPAPPTGAAGEEGHEHTHAERIKLSPQARANLRLVVKPLKPESYWRTIQVPGMVVDRPGQSDRGVTAPVVGVVSRVHAHPGDTVRPGEVLFTLRMVSEYLQNAQTELFKATRELQLTEEQKQRLAPAVRSGAVPDTRMVELENQVRRQAAIVQAYRQDLLTRGLTPEQIKGVEEGQFVAEVRVFAPQPAPDNRLLAGLKPSPGLGGERGLAFEVEDLKVRLGEQVQAGQTLALLANHQALYIEGRGFKQEAPLLESAVEGGWPVQVEFAEEAGAAWPPLEQTFRIRYLANSIDPVSRTLAFYLPLANQSRAYEKEGRTLLVWRFRPGERVRLKVPVEEIKDVFVLPAEGVVREGGEVYAFRQNGDAFERKPVRLVHQDRDSAVLANDGSLAAGQYVVRNAAATLNRILKAQSAGGEEGHDHGHGHSHAGHSHEH